MGAPCSLTSRGRLVRIGKGDPPVGAKELGPVTVTEGVYCAASDDDCSPPCSPGFTCDEGACEPECNPQCSANQVCRVDRTCGPPATGDGAK